MKESQKVTIHKTRSWLCVQDREVSGTVEPNKHSQLIRRAFELKNKDAALLL